MERVQNQNETQSIYCRYQNENNNDRSYQYAPLDNQRDDPLRQPEITVNLSQGSGLLPLQPEEEPEEDLFNDFEADVSMQEGNTDTEEQVVPSSQLSSTYKYPEDDLTISDDDVDEGIFEDDVGSDELTDHNNRYDSQPP